MTDKLKVVNISEHTRLPTEADEVLKGAIGALEHVLLIGIDIEGDYSYSSSIGDKGKLIYWMESFKHKLLSVDFD